MSEELEQKTEAEGVVENVEPQGSTDSTDWKAEARKWEKRAKDSREAAEKWHEYEESLKPVQERMAEELEAARRLASESQTALMRYEIANEKGIPAEAMKLLVGSTREELEESAEVLQSLIAEQSKPKSPKPDLSQGKPASASPTTADAFAAAIGDLL